MTVIAVSAPEGELWHGRVIQVCGASAQTILTLNGTFTWSDLKGRWLWTCDSATSLVWPEPSSAEHEALMAEFTYLAPRLRMPDERPAA